MPQKPVNMSGEVCMPDLYNWYHGYTWLRYPVYDHEHNQLRYFVITSATSGNITTKHFGDNFDATKVDGNILIKINVNVPKSARKKENTTLFFNLEKNTLKDVSDNDQMYILTVGDIDADKTYVNEHDTAPLDKFYYIRLNRKVTIEDIKHIKQDKMHGFRFKWNYNKEVELLAKYKTHNNQFTRLAFSNCQLI